MMAHHIHGLSRQPGIMFAEKHHDRVQPCVHIETPFPKFRALDGFMADELGFLEDVVREKRSGAVERVEFGEGLVNEGVVGWEDLHNFTALRLLPTSPNFLPTHSQR